MDIFVWQARWMRMARWNDRGRRTPGTKRWSWRRSSTSTATWRGGVASRSRMPFAWRNVKSRSGSRIDGWSGKRSIRWRAWTLFRTTCRRMATLTSSRPTQASSLIWPHRTSSRPPSSEHTLSGSPGCTASRTSKRLFSCSRLGRRHQRL